MRYSLAVLLTSTALLAQGPPAVTLTPGRQVDTQTMSRAVQALRGSSTAGDAAKASADKLIAEAAQAADSRRKLAGAWALLSNRAWDAKEEYIWSLSLSSDRAVADSALPFTGEVTQYYAATYRPAGGLKLKLALEPQSKTGAAAREIGVVTVGGGNLADDPSRFDVSLEGVADGPYTLVGEVMEGGAAISRMEKPVVVINGIESQRAAIDKRLAKIQGHDSAKASVRWPYDMARIVNLGIRKLNSGDFGLREDRYNSFDFVKEMRDSQMVLKALEAGKDPVFRAKGDNERHYWFEAAGEVMPYRMYVPLKWDGKAKLKMLFVMHGNSRDHDFYFDRDNQILSKLAEQYGWLVVCPMGYRPNAGYNAANLRNIPGAGAPPDRGGRGGGGGGRGGFDPARQQRQTELSEMDAMNVLDLVQKEYPIDMAHVYLFGHSAGGTGGWYVAAKYPEKFAGIALSAFGTRPETYPFERIKGKALMVIIGTKDAPNTVATARAMAKTLEEKGYERYFLEVEDATHDTIVGLAEPKVFEFFDKHSRK